MVNSNKKNRSLKLWHKDFGEIAATDWIGPVFDYGEFVANDDKAPLKRGMVAEIPDISHSFEFDCYGWIQKCTPKPETQGVVERLPDLYAELSNIVFKYLQDPKGFKWGQELGDKWNSLLSELLSACTPKAGDAEYAIKYLCLTGDTNTDHNLPKSITIKVDQAGVNYITFERVFVPPKLFTHTGMRKQLEMIYLIHQQVFDSDSLLSIHEWTEVIANYKTVFSKVDAQKNKEIQPLTWIETLGLLISRVKKSVFLSGALSKREIADCITSRLVMYSTIYAINAFQFEGQAQLGEMTPDFLRTVCRYNMTGMPDAFVAWGTRVKNKLDILGYPFPGGVESWRCYVEIKGEITNYLTWGMSWSQATGLSGNKQAADDVMLNSTLMGEPLYYDLKSSSWYKLGGYSVDWDGQAVPEDMTQNQILVVSKVETYMKLYAKIAAYGAPEVRFSVKTSTGWTEFIGSGCMDYEAMQVAVGFRPSFKGKMFRYDGNIPRYKTVAGSRLERVKETLELLTKAKKYDKALEWMDICISRFRSSGEDANAHKCEEWKAKIIEVLPKDVKFNGVPKEEEKGKTEKKEKEVVPEGPPSTVTLYILTSKRISEAIVAGQKWKYKFGKLEKMDSHIIREYGEKNQLVTIGWFTEAAAFRSAIASNPKAQYGFVIDWNLWQKGEELENRMAYAELNAKSSHNESLDVEGGKCLPSVNNKDFTKALTFETKPEAPKEVPVETKVQPAAPTPPEKEEKKNA